MPPGAPARAGVAVVLVNRAARGARGFAWEAPVLARLGRRWRVELLRPDTPESAARAARDAAAAGAEVVVAAGGDGTMHVVANALAGGTTPMGVLALGTANDLARALGVPRAPAAAAEHLAATHSPRAVDLIDADGRAICTVGGLGVVSAGALLANRVRRGGGPLPRAMRAIGGGVYKVTASALLLTPRAAARPVALRWREGDGGAWREARDEAHGVFVANHPFLGAGLRLPHVPAASDGAFELLVVRRTPRPRLLAAFARLTLGLPIPASVLRVVRTTEAEVACDAPDVLLADGDAVREGRTFHFRARPGALRVLG